MFMKVVDSGVKFVAHLVNSARQLVDAVTARLFQTKA